MESEELRLLVTQFAVADDTQRGLAADSVVDLVQSTDQATGAVVSRALEVMLMIEESHEALEAQLHSLAELAEWDLVPHDVIVRVISSRTWDQPWAGEYVDYLRSAARNTRARLCGDGRPGLPTFSSGEAAAQTSFLQAQDAPR